MFPQLLHIMAWRAYALGYSSVVEDAGRLTMLEVRLT